MTLRITDPKELDRLVKRGRISKSALSSVQKTIKKTNEIAQKNTSEDKLYQLLLPIYGDFFNDEGGQLVKELKVLPDRKFRLDVALVNSRVICDIDGLEGHAVFFNPKTNQNVPNIDGFRRDRSRDMLLTTKGWLTLRCTRYHIDNEPQLIFRRSRSSSGQAKKITY